MPVASYPLISVRVPTDMAGRVDTLAGARFKNRTAETVRALINVGLQYYEHYDEFNDPKKRGKAAATMTAAEAESMIAVWQQTLPSYQFETLTQIMQIKNDTRHDKAHELQKQLAQKEIEIKRLKGAAAK